MPQPDTSLLTATLVGYAQQKGEIEAKIAAIKKTLGGRAATPGGGCSKAEEEVGGLSEGTKILSCVKSLIGEFRDLME